MIISIEELFVYGKRQGGLSGKDSRLKLWSQPSILHSAAGLPSDLQWVGLSVSFCVVNGHNKTGLFAKSFEIYKGEVLHSSYTLLHY